MTRLLHTLLKKTQEWVVVVPPISASGAGQHDCSSAMQQEITLLGVWETAVADAA